MAAKLLQKENVDPANPAGVASPIYIQASLAGRLIII